MKLSKKFWLFVDSSTMDDDQTVSAALSAIDAFTPAAIEAYQKEAKTSGVGLYEYLVSRDLVKDENIGMAIANYIKLPFVNLASYPVKKESVLKLPREFAEFNKLLLFDESDGVAYLAVSNTSDNKLLINIGKRINKKVKLYFATSRAISQAMTFYDAPLAKSFADLIGGSLTGTKGKIEDQPIDKIVDLIVSYAANSRASDIHIEPEKNYTQIRFRIDGILHDVLKAPIAMHNEIIFRIKVLAKLRTDEHLNAQDGKFQADVDKNSFDIRVSIAPTADGEKAVLRLLSDKSRQYGLSDLGMRESDLEKVRKALARPWGMILATGPTGSGKTTTVYAIVKILNTREKNIATIENPVEYQIEGVNQIQVNPDTNLTFANGLRSILRQDPDIIFVGEIRDEETADIAVNSAMTGHLVLSTLHTNDAATTLPRLSDLKIKPFLISSTVNLIIAQRLIRKVCEKCRVSKTVAKKDFQIPINKVLLNKYFSGDEIRYYEGKGCAVCHETGYKGRIGIFELLEINDPIRNLINSNADSKTIMTTAIKGGMQPLIEDGLEKVQSGLTTFEEMLRAVAV